MGLPPFRAGRTYVHRCGVSVIPFHQVTLGESGDASEGRDGVLWHLLDRAH